MSETTLRPGACKFCGQIHVDAQSGETQEARDIEATNICTCGDARTYREKQRQLYIANAKIDEFFTNPNIEEYGFSQIKNEKIIDILRVAVELVANNRIEQLQIRIDGRTTGTIMGSTNGKIKVIRTEKQTLKAEE